MFARGLLRTVGTFALSARVKWPTALARPSPQSSIAMSAPSGLREFLLQQGFGGGVGRLKALRAALAILEFSACADLEGAVGYAIHRGVTACAYLCLWHTQAWRGAGFK